MPTLRRIGKQRISTTAGIALAILAVAVPQGGQSAVSYTGSLQFASGDYLFSRPTQSFSLYSGLTYSQGIFEVSLNVPLIYQNSPWVTFQGFGMIPSGGTQHGQVGKGPSGTQNQKLSLPDTTQYSRFGVGDPKLQVEAQVLQEGEIVPSLTLTGDVKTPVASVDRGFGTGKWDYSVGLSISKIVEPWFVQSQASYWILGDFPDLELMDPIVYNVSVGRFFSDKFLLAANLAGQSRIIRGEQAVVQVGLEGDWNVHEGLGLVLAVNFGLTDTASDVAAGLGWQVDL